MNSMDGILAHPVTPRSGPAVMTSASVRLSDGAGNVVVVVGPGIDTPKLPGLVDEGRKHCRLTVELLVVIYGGQDVGSSWRYSVTVEGCLWNSGPRAMQWGETDVVGAVVCDRVLNNGCGLPRQVSIEVRARERGGFWLDDIGEGFGLIFLRCIELGSSAQLSVPVPVAEFQSKMLRSILRLPSKKALLQFIFQVRAQCLG